ncbi:uncharacterized protein LOC135683403 isoform X2 [Rhopilema esculentum]|eukprot:gene5241-387_t
MRYQDSENVLNSNGRSESYHLAGTVNKHGVRQEFCTKFDSNDGTGDWPTGQYCIYRYGPTCPQGLIEGWIFWDDENDEMIDSESLYQGYVPAGIYEKDTLIYTCCRTDGDKKVPISLPLAQPFYLLAFGSSECQTVSGARSLSEFIKWDDEDKGNRNDNSRIVPYDVKKGRWNTKIYFCYYEFGGCGVNGAVCTNSTDHDDTQAAKSAVVDISSKRADLPGFATTSKSSSGMAVAIGSFVAGTICGTAGLIFVVKHYLNKKAGENEGGIDDDEEEEVIPMPDEIW